MAHTQDMTHRRGVVEPPDTPAQTYAAITGIFLVALGVLSLILEPVSFDGVGPVAAQPEFLIWSVSGWTTIFWIALGGIGLLSAARLDSARSFALGAGIVMAVAAVWGFIDGSDVAGIITADTTNNITHAVIGGLGLLVAALPRSAQRPGEGDASRTAPPTRAGGSPRGATHH
jgi:hypothetical protein